MSWVLTAARYTNPCAKTLDGVDILRYPIGNKTFMTQSLLTMDNKLHSDTTNLFNDLPSLQTSTTLFKHCLLTRFISQKIRSIQYVTSSIRFTKDLCIKLPASICSTYANWQISSLPFFHHLVVELDIFRHTHPNLFEENNTYQHLSSEISLSTILRFLLFPCIPSIIERFQCFTPEEETLHFLQHDTHLSPKQYLILLDLNKTIGSPMTNFVSPYAVTFPNCCNTCLPLKMRPTH
jgi:hypothetical protein